MKARETRMGLDEYIECPVCRKTAAIYRSRYGRPEVEVAYCRHCGYRRKRVETGEGGWLRPMRTIY